LLFSGTGILPVTPLHRWYSGGRIQVACMGATAGQAGSRTRIMIPRCRRASRKRRESS